jgi:hypothetical protein
MINNTQKERIIVDIALSLCIFLIPSYLTLLLSSLLIARYKRYIEFPIFALLLDTIYKSHSFAYIGLFGWSLLLLVVVELFRGNIKIKQRDTL